MHYLRPWCQRAIISFCQAPYGCLCLDKDPQAKFTHWCSHRRCRGRVHPLIVEHEGSSGTSEAPLEFSSTQFSSSIEFSAGLFLQVPPPLPAPSGSSLLQLCDNLLRQLQELSCTLSLAHLYFRLHCRHWTTAKGLIDSTQTEWGFFL
jgi:hypothetical protein